MPRRVRDALGSVLILLALVVVLAGIDGRVRGRVGRAATDISTGGWEAPSSAVSDVMTTVWPGGYLENSYLLAFFGAGLVLVFLMLRT